MKFDIFFSISHTPVAGKLPTEKVLWQNFMSQVQFADDLEMGVAWVAGSHLSSQTQKKNPNPVIPHWQGEVGLNGDILQLTQNVFRKTKKIEMGSAVMNLLANGGPIAHAERIATFLAQQEAFFDEKRKLHIGFSQGRFDYMSRAYGVRPRNTQENENWNQVKPQIFAEACEIFLRLLRKEEISSKDITRRSLDPFYEFEKLKIVPQEFSLKNLQLIIGSHDPSLQVEVNQFLPVQVFNLSITKPEVIEETHTRMQAAYHKEGGPWKRDYMPRTVFVFIDEDTKKAKIKSEHALSAYWNALEGTLDPKKLQNAANNALIGNPEEICAQISARFHPEDRLMLWFDFFNHNNEDVQNSMKLFMNQVAAKFA